MASNAIDQTRRMLSLVTYLRERPGARVEDVARAFGITEDELISDLDVLPLCGTSFRGGDLLDIDTDGDRIWWHNPDDVAEPLRIAADEATALLVAARAVATLPGLRESDRLALLRATAKLETAAGEVAGASARLSVTFESEGGVFADVDRAISERRRLWIRYYSPARDEVTEREIDPIRLVSVGHTYVEAWCRRSEARRTFRLDRVAEIKVLDEPSAPPQVELRDLSEGLCSPRPRTPRWSSRSGPAGAGSPSTTRTTAPRSCRTAGCGSRCARRTRPRCAGSRCGSAGTGTSCRPPSWRPVRRPRRARRSWRTTGRREGVGRAPGSPATYHDVRCTTDKWCEVCDMTGVAGFTGIAEMPATATTVAPVVFRAGCPDCRARFELAASAIRLAIGASSRTTFYSFTCPECETSVRKPAGERIIELLTGGGVRTLRLHQTV